MISDDDLLRDFGRPASVQHTSDPSASNRSSMPAYDELFDPSSNVYGPFGRFARSSSVENVRLTRPSGTPGSDAHGTSVMFSGLLHRDTGLPHGYGTRTTTQSASANHPTVRDALRVNPQFEQFASKVNFVVSSVLTVALWINGEPNGKGMERVTVSGTLHLDGDGASFRDAPGQARLADRDDAQSFVATVCTWLYEGVWSDGRRSGRGILSCVTNGSVDEVEYSAETGARVHCTNVAPPHPVAPLSKTHSAWGSVASSPVATPEPRYISRASSRMLGEAESPMPTPHGHHPQVAIISSRVRTATPRHDTRGDKSTTPTPPPSQSPSVQRQQQPRAHHRTPSTARRQVVPHITAARHVDCSAGTGPYSARAPSSGPKLRRALPAVGSALPPPPPSTARASSAMTDVSLLARMVLEMHQAPGSSQDGMRSQHDGDLAKPIAGNGDECTASSTGRISARRPPQPPFRIGQRVMVTAQREEVPGTVMYCGPPRHAVKDSRRCRWVVGVATDAPRRGGHDGTARGVTYFVCEVGHGILVPHDLVVPIGMRQPFT